MLEKHITHVARKCWRASLKTWSVNTEGTREPRWRWNSMNTSSQRSVFEKVLHSTRAVSGRNSYSEPRSRHHSRTTRCFVSHLWRPDTERSIPSCGSVQRWSGRFPSRPRSYRPQMDWTASGLLDAWCSDSIAASEPESSRYNRPASFLNPTRNLPRNTSVFIQMIWDRWRSRIFPQEHSIPTFILHSTQKSPQFCYDLCFITQFKCNGLINSFEIQSNITIFNFCCFLAVTFDHLTTLDKQSCFFLELSAPGPRGLCTPSESSGHTVSRGRIYGRFVRQLLWATSPMHRLLGGAMRTPTLDNGFSQCWTNWRSTVSSPMNFPHMRSCVSKCAGGYSIRSWTTNSMFYISCSLQREKCHILSDLERTIGPFQLHIIQLSKRISWLLCYTRTAIRYSATNLSVLLILLLILF